MKIIGNTDYSEINPGDKKYDTQIFFTFFFHFLDFLAKSRVKIKDKKREDKNRAGMKKSENVGKHYMAFWVR